MIDMASLFTFIPHSPDEKLTVGFEEAAAYYEWLQFRKYRLDTDIEAVRAEFREHEELQQRNTWTERYLTQEEFLQLTLPITKETTKMGLTKPISLEAFIREGAIVEGYIPEHTVLTSPFEEPGVVSIQNKKMVLHTCYFPAVAHAHTVLIKNGTYVPFKVLIGDQQNQPVSVDTSRSLLAVQDQETEEVIEQSELLNIFMTAEQLYFILSEDSQRFIHGLGILHAVLNMQAMLNLPEKKMYLYVDSKSVSLLTHFAREHTIELKGYDNYEVIRRALDDDSSPEDGTSAVIFDCASADENGIIAKDNGMRLQIRNLIDCLLQRYPLQMFGLHQSGILLSDLFGVDYSQFSVLDCLPQITLPLPKETYIANFVKKYNLDLESPQIALLMNSQFLKTHIQELIGSIEAIQRMYPDAQFSLMLEGPSDAETVGHLQADALHVVEEAGIDRFQYLRLQDLIIAQNDEIARQVSITEYDDMGDIILMTQENANQEEQMPLSPTIAVISKLSDVAGQAIETLRTSYEPTQSETMEQAPLEDAEKTLEVTSLEQLASMNTPSPEPPVQQ